jgi:hypothetical protein
MGCLEHRSFKPISLNDFAANLLFRDAANSRRNFFNADIKARPAPRISGESEKIRPSEEADMHCMECTIQTFLLDIVSSSFFASAMIRLMGLYKYLGYLA